MFDTVFDLFFNGMIAFNQIGWLLGGLIFSVLGGLLLGNGFYWRLRATRVEGEIIGVRQKKKDMYHSVYRYTLPSGETMEATSDTGSNITSGRETGKRVTLMVFPDKPDQVRESGGYWMGIFGVIFLAPGIFMCYMALTAYPVTPMTGIIAIGMIAVIALRARKYIIPKEQRQTPADWMARKKKERHAEIEAAPVKPFEDVMSGPAWAEKQVQAHKNARIGAPLTLIIAAGLIWGGIYLGQKTMTLQNNGVRAAGEVVRLEESRSSDSSTYHPVVAFTDAGGQSFTFRDSMGSNPPSYHTGEAVTVLYLSDNPEESAAIDRGIFNWIVPGLLGGFGVLLLFASLGLFRQLRQNERR